ncbi:unnamed protein product [Parascedosporium putredinis]|uniref:Uncharacterized protein n=1 Tax=Parascedosporium putredinis TaxID=1442378 RepID=A0A9P1H990_9PEZI|nr:unnamed protein product [Parascedosporium putredinis]CAI8000727.1 unnamed protein product [Parascedosporium putredinis]
MRRSCMLKGTNSKSRERWPDSRPAPCRVLPESYAHPVHRQHRERRQKILHLALDIAKRWYGRSTGRGLAHYKSGIPTLESEGNLVRAAYDTDAKVMRSSKAYQNKTSGLEARFANEAAFASRGTDEGLQENTS